MKLIRKPHSIPWWFAPLVIPRRVREDMARRAPLTGRSLRSFEVWIPIIGLLSFTIGCEIVDDEPAGLDGPADGVARGCPQRDPPITRRNGL